MKTKTQVIPPKPPNDKAVGCGFSGNNELGEQIAALTPDEARELRDYLIIVWGNPSPGAGWCCRSTEATEERVSNENHKDK